MLKLFTTTLQAIDPKDGQLKKWSGPYVAALSFEHAEHIVQEMGKGFLVINGILEEVIEMGSDYTIDDMMTKLICNIDGREN